MLWLKNFYYADSRSLFSIDFLPFFLSLSASQFPVVESKSKGPKTLGGYCILLVNYHLISPIYRGTLFYLVFRYPCISQLFPFHLDFKTCQVHWLLATYPRLSQVHAKHTGARINCRLPQTHLYRQFLKTFLLISCQTSSGTFG